MNIYVGNLSFNTTESQLEAAFAPYGTVKAVRIAVDRDTGRGRGFGFVEMDNPNEAQAAIRALDGTRLQDRTLTVNEARPREEGSRSSGNRGSGGRFGGDRGGRGGRW